MKYLYLNPSVIYLVRVVCNKGLLRDEEYDTILVNVTQHKREELGWMMMSRDPKKRLHIDYMT